jgi:DNA-directed RNA polymerase subunit L
MATFTNIKFQENKKLSFTINDTDLSLVNSIRRIILAEVPNVAFSFDANDIEHTDIHINRNTCALHNEFLSHRISLIPLFYTENEINTFEDNSYRFVLKKQNNTYENIDVTTKDFEVYDDKGNKLNEAFRERILPKNPITKEYILITRLKPNLHDEHTPPRGETVDIECVPTVANAMKHARWSHVSQCCFGNAIDQDAANTKFEEIVSQHEKEQGRSLSKTEREQLNKRFNTLEVFRCFKKNKYDEANCFEFKLETETALRPAYLFFKACKILMGKVEQFANNLKNVTDNGNLQVVVSTLSGVPNFYQVLIKNENYTLLNVLQSNIYNICMRQTPTQENPLEYIGYYQPHPLDDQMVLKLKFKHEQDTSIKYVKEFLVAKCEAITDIINNLTKEWLAAVGHTLKDIQEFQEYQTS